MLRLYDDDWDGDLTANNKIVRYVKVVDVPKENWTRTSLDFNEYQLPCFSFGAIDYNRIADYKTGRSRGDDKWNGDLKEIEKGYVSNVIEIMLDFDEFGFDTVFVKDVEEAEIVELMRKAGAKKFGDTITVIGNDGKSVVVNTGRKGLKVGNQIHMVYEEVSSEYFENKFRAWLDRLRESVCEI